MKKKHLLPDGLAVCGALLLLLALGLIAFLFPQSFSNWEKRYLAQAPRNFDPVQWTLNDDTETYLSDQMPLRQLLVNVHAQAQALTGRAVQLDAWPQGDAIIEKPVTASADTLQSRCDALAAFAGDIPCHFLTPPTHGSLLRDEMGAARRAVYDQESALYDALMARGDFVPLADAFEGQAHAYYYRTDHHWTLEGAYAAYQRYCDAAGLTPADWTGFELTQYAPFLGSTCSRSGLPFASADTLHCAEPKAALTLTIADDGSEYDHLIFPEQAASYDGYTVYLQGNHGLAVIETPGAPQRTLLLCKDSFANSFIPFLTANFSRIVAVDARYYAGSFRDALAAAGHVDEILFLYSLDSLANDTSILRKLRQ